MAGDVDLLILGVSSAGVDWAIERMAEALRAPVPTVIITKGLVGLGARDRGDPDNHRPGSSRSGTGLAVPVMAIGGPCIAGELAAGRDTSVVMTGADSELVERTRALLDTVPPPWRRAEEGAGPPGPALVVGFEVFDAEQAAVRRLDVAHRRGHMSDDRQAGFPCRAQ